MVSLTIMVNSFVKQMLSNRYKLKADDFKYLTFESKDRAQKIFNGLLFN